MAQILVTADKSISTTPLTVSFLATVVSGEIVSYHWDFGDGQTSTEKDPVHTYVTTGFHTVVLTALDGDGATVTVTKRAFIRLGELSFTASPDSSDEAPLSVSFTNTSFAPTGYEFTDWSWDFGDVTIGSGATGPSHIYGEYGSYNVFLSARMTKI